MTERSTQILNALALKLEEMITAIGPSKEGMHVVKAAASVSLAACAYYAPCRRAASRLEQSEMASALPQVVLARLDPRCAAWAFDLEIIEENLMALLDAAPRT